MQTKTIIRLKPDGSLPAAKSVPISKRRKAASGKPGLVDVEWYERGEDKPRLTVIDVKESDFSVMQIDYSDPDNWKMQGIRHCDPVAHGDLRLPPPALPRSNGVRYLPRPSRTPEQYWAETGSFCQVSDRHGSMLRMIKRRELFITAMEQGYCVGKGCL